MRLASLTLHGFKSFGDRTSIEIAPGVTALIGPNGSGKSNLVDALKWATGGGRASSYRAGDKRELIFHGADGKRGMGLAEVEVEFEDNDRSLKIARSLDRDGTAKLRLNGRAARLLDVDDALAGSGLGRAGVSVIGQGEVGQVLMADPTKLLSYVAEAAGVSKLSGRRDLSSARLDTARQHLERLGDVLLELELNLDRLELEAAQAARHAALSREVLLLRFTLASARRDGLRGEIRKLLSRQIELSERLERGREQLHQREAHQREARAALRSGEDAFREAQALSERRRAEVRVAEVRLSASDVQRASLVTQRDRLLLELEQLRSVESPIPPEGDPTLLRSLEAELEAAWSALVHDLAVAEARLGERRVSFDRARAEETRRLERASYARARRDELTAQREHAAAALAELERVDLPDLDGADVEAAAARERSQLAERRVAEFADVLERTQSEYAGAAAESQALARADARQRAAHEARRDYALGPRVALTSGLSGVVGSVADLVSVPQQLRVAVASTLGRRAESIVIERAEDAAAILERVRSSKGWVTLLPLDLVRPRSPLAKRWRDTPGVVGIASELVEADDRYAAVVSQLLGGVVVVEDFARALELSRDQTRRPRLVTLDGTLIEPGGAVSGGRQLQRTGVFGAPLELAEAETAAASASADERVAYGALEAARGALVAARSEAANASGALRDALERQRQSRAVADRHAARSSELRERLAALESDLARLEVPAASSVEDEKFAVLARELQEADRAVAAMRERLEGARSERDGAQRARLLFESERRAYELAHGRFVSQRERLAALTQLEGDLTKQLDVLADERGREEAALAAAVALLPDDLDQKREERDGLERSLEAAEAAVRETGEAQAEAAQELETCRVQLARREAALELALEEMSAFPEGLDPLETGERLARVRLRGAREELEALGAVNHRARHDFEAARERHDGLARDMEDAEAAVGELEGVLSDLDAETDARYERAIGELQLSFALHIEELFGADAQGSIEVERFEGRHHGLRIHLTPPGKRTQALGLLSVGERTMGALAFLFALMSGAEGEGLPIAVLDEVDAPLDEANIRRYCAFLERLATRGTQFVLVTHQKATFEVADVLWGVTTERGVSRVFSIRKEERTL